MMSTIPDPLDYPVQLPTPDGHPLAERPTPEQWATIQHALGEHGEVRP